MFLLRMSAQLKMILDWSTAAKDIDSVSDGVKAFTGMLLQLYAGENKIITNDEPEAFLHPSLSSKLGQEIAKIALRRKSNFYFYTAHTF